MNMHKSMRPLRALRRLCGEILVALSSRRINAGGEPGAVCLALSVCESIAVRELKTAGPIEREEGNQ